MAALDVAMRMLMRMAGVPWKYSRCKFVVVSVMAAEGWSSVHRRHH